MERRTTKSGISRGPFAGAVCHVVCAEHTKPHICRSCLRMAFRSVLLLFLLQYCSHGLWAGPRTADHATKAVKGWLRANPGPLGKGLGQKISDVDTFSDADEKPVYYVVYLEPSGFVIVSADDLVEPIIGFAGDGVYDSSLTNPLGALTDQDVRGRVLMARQYEATPGAHAQGAGHPDRFKWNLLEAIAEPFNDRSVEGGVSYISDIRVAPLIQTKWYQDAVCFDLDYCYNYYTPNHYSCGCVATAMAQLMRYYEHPSIGVSTACFTVYVNGSSQTKCLRGGDGFGGPYQWYQMVQEPGCDTDIDQRQAIGTLCYDTGISVGMYYAFDGSSADTLDAADALTDVFKYSYAVKGYNSNSNIGTGLTAMLNPNLDAQQPVILGIRGSNGGHAILADGYGYSFSTLYHHLNMGWAGSYDAWYNLPGIDSWPSFTTVHKCVYNVSVSETGEIVSGRVTDKDSSPISDAAVTAEGNGGPYSVTTNDNGIYALVGVKSNSTYTINVTKSGYDFTPQSTVVSTGESKDNARISGNKWGIDFEGVPQDTPKECATVEDFETSNFSNFPWMCSGSSNWSIASSQKHTGAYCAKAGMISNSQSTSLEVTLDCVSGETRFYRKVSSESGYDYLKFYIDGSPKGSWSGSQEWSEVSYPVLAGTRTFKWTYSKDSTASSGVDTAWIDDIEFPVECPPDPDGDGFIGWGDVAVLSEQWLSSGSDLDGDVNHDGVVDFRDFVKLAGAW